MAVNPVKKKLTKEEIESRKDHVKILYTKENITTQKELALRVGISEKTIGKWVAEEREQWDKLKKNLLLTREEQMLNLYDELTEINAFIKKAPEGSRFADARMGDVRRKLVKDIKELETKAALPEMIHSCMTLLNFIRQADLKIAQDLSKWVDAFIKSQLR
ncbi:MAG: transcriptional regulator [Mucilaginibacter sp.]|nr:transcriptional regulator [Mucilaginibacter sp.]